MLDYGGELYDLIDWGGSMHKSEISESFKGSDIYMDGKRISDLIHTIENWQRKIKSIERDKEQLMTKIINHMKSNGIESVQTGTETWYYIAPGRVELTESAYAVLCSMKIDHLYKTWDNEKIKKDFPDYTVIKYGKEYLRK